MRFWLATVFLPTILFADPAVTAQKVADDLVAAINANDAPAARNSWSKELTKALPLETWNTVVQQLRDQAGKLGAPVRSDAAPHQHLFVIKCERATINLKLVLDADGKLTGLWFGPHKPRAPVPARNKTPLTLPFTDQWVVLWGGDTREQNYHRDEPNQRFAFDFLGIGPDGKTHRGEGEQNEDYYAFGRKIFAPADGTVVEVIEGVRDNVPGSLNPYSALGNVVILEHAPLEISVLAHFKQDSIVVKRGQNVKRGDLLGLCGNSGNSSEPHLHYHLQNVRILQDAVGIKVHFRKLSTIANQKPTELLDYSPVKGEIIAP